MHRAYVMTEGNTIAPGVVAELLPGAVRTEGVRAGGSKNVREKKKPAPKKS